MPSFGFVGVHIGAGQHSEARTPLYLSICSAACKKAVQSLKEGKTALEAAAEATKVLEDAGETNAGYGSNLVSEVSFWLVLTQQFLPCRLRRVPWKWMRA